MPKNYSEIIPFFMAAKSENLCVLLVNNKNIMPIIKEKMPQAKIYEMIGTFCEANQEMILTQLEGDLKKDKYIFSKDSFDYIIVNDVVGSLNNIIKNWRFLLSFLKTEGEIIASFPNKFHWKQLEKTSGAWQYKKHQKKEGQSFSLIEIVQMFEKAKYKDLQFAASYDIASSQLLKELTALGFSNEHEELIVLFWGISASKINRKASFLRKSFTEPIRENIVFLLRRIENEIDSDENCRKLYQFCQTQMIAHSYVVDLAYNALIHPAKAIYMVAIYLYEHKNNQDATVLLSIAYENFPEDDLVIYALITFLCLQKQERIAIEILCEYKGSDADVLRLKDELRGKIHGR